MIKGVNKIAEVLSAPGMPSQLSNKIYWSLAGRDEVLPFVVFEVSVVGPFSKDRLSEHEAVIRVYADTLTASAELGESVVDHIKTFNNPKIYASGMTTRYADEQAREAFTEINYSFKI